MIRAKAHAILEGDPPSASPLAKSINTLIIAVTLISVVCIIMESHKPTYQNYTYILILIENTCVALFTIEFLFRLWVQGAAEGTQSPGVIRSRIAYLTSFHGIVDWISIAPFYLQFFFPGVDLLILRVLRLLRLLKISRYNSALDDLLLAVRSERYTFSAALYIIFIVTILSSSLMYYAEGAAQPDHLASIPHAIYWSLITLTTVGYGDVSPITPLGKIISTLTALLGVATVAMFAGIIASSFSRQVARRQRIFEQELENAYEDGVLTKDEEALLQELKNRFSLSDEEVNDIRKRVLKL